MVGGALAAMVAEFVRGSFSHRDLLAFANIRLRFFLYITAKEQ